MAIFASFLAGAALFYLHIWFPCASVAASLVALSLIVRYGYKGIRIDWSSARTGLASAILIIIFAALGFWRASSAYVPPPDYIQLSGKTIELRAVVESDPLRLRPDSQRYMNQMDVKEASLDNAKLNITKMRLFSEGLLVAGREYRISARVSGDATVRNPGSMERVPAGYIESAEELASAPLGLLDSSRQKINRMLTKNFPGDTGAFLMSIITGERAAMSSELKQAFNVTGLAHILSISGAHFGLLLFILFRLFKSLLMFMPHRMLLRVTLYASPSQIAAALAFPILTAYLGISTMEFPAVRSFIMISLFMAGLLIQRQGFWLNTLLLAAVIIVGMQPEAMLDLSCQLSFLAVLCLGLYADLERRRTENQQTEIKREYVSTAQQRALFFISRLVKGGMRYVAASAAISIAATIGTAPLVASVFNYFSIISPLSNMIVTPLIGFIILPVALLSSFIYLIFDIFPLVAFIKWTTELSLNLTRIMGSWDFAVIRIVSLPGILLVTFYAGLFSFSSVSFLANRTREGWRSHKKAAIASIAVAIIPLFIYSAITLLQKNKMDITFIDAGQADSAVITLPDSKVMVIDTGRNGFHTAGHLRHMGRSVIDLLVITHDHPDHSGGFEYLLANFRVREIWLHPHSAVAALIPEGILSRDVERGDMVTGDGYSISVLHPYKGYYSRAAGRDDENDRSVVLRIEGNGMSALFTGDISEEAEEDIAHLGGRLRSDVIKVPHHGSRRSLSDIFMYEVKPRIAVISSGRANTFGHPHADTLQKLSSLQTYITARDGAVGVKGDASGIKVRIWEDMRIRPAANFSEERSNWARLFMSW